MAAELADNVTVKPRGFTVKMSPDDRAPLDLFMVADVDGGAYDGAAVFAFRAAPGLGLRDVVVPITVEMAHAMMHAMIDVMAGLGVIPDGDAE